MKKRETEQHRKARERFQGEYDKNPNGSIFDLLVTYRAEGIREELTAMALRCEANFKDCDKANVSCHMIDAEAIRARLRTLESEEKE